MDIKYTIDPDFDFIIEEKGNQFMALRKIAWSENAPKESMRLDLRKWYSNSNGETIGKGVSFSTEEGPGELIKVLATNGYGDTKEILESIKDREDFRKSLNSILSPDDELYDSSIKSEEFYDPKTMLID